MISFLILFLDFSIFFCYISQEFSLEKAKESSENGITNKIGSSGTGGKYEIKLILPDYSKIVFNLF